MKTWEKASLVIQTLELRANEITQILKQEPSQFSEKGNKISNRTPNSPNHKVTSWILESNLDDTIELEKHLDQLLLFIDSKYSELFELAKRCNLYISIAYAFTNMGEIFFNSNILKKLSVLPINIVIDLFSESEDD